MALAKYLEDIEERRHEETAGRYESYLSQLFELLPARPVESGEVYLTRGNRRMEDIEVCEAGQMLDLVVVAISNAAAPVVELEKETGWHELRITSLGAFNVTLEKTGTCRLQVSSGGYIKFYSIQVVEKLQIELLPDFAELIKSLANNLPEWSATTFQVFCAKLKDILEKASVPELFIRGIIDYHLGLFHEEQRLSAFRERFQTAYGCLRWFIPYSDIARLICTYYLYIANEFEAASNLCLNNGGRLRRATAFFSGKTKVRPVGDQSSKLSKEGLPLLMALTDVLTFQAIEALDNNRVENAEELAEVIRRDTDESDKERQARNCFLKAFICKEKGDLLESRRYFQSLLHSPWEVIASSAQKHLK
jgi:hypothetical protein